MGLNKQAWKQAAMILLALALIMPLAAGFEAISSNITANKTTLGTQGNTGEGYYDARFTTTHQQPGSYPATSTNITANIGWYDITRGNTNPDITRIYIRSSTGQNLTTDSITCYVNATDLDNTTLTIYYHWYNNSVQIPALSGETTAISDTLTNISTISPSRTSTGENWTCEAKAWDGYYNETNWNNASIIILRKEIPGGAGGGAAGGGVVHKDVPQPCTEAWTCTDWSNCTNNTKTRNCTDINSCPEPKYKPAETAQCRIVSKIQKAKEPEKAIPTPPEILKTGQAITKPKPGKDITYTIIQTAKQNHIILRDKIIQALSILSRNTQTISLILNHLIIITIIAAMLIYFRKLHKEHRRSTITRRKVYFLLGISITGLLIHYTRFHEKTIPAYIAITAILLLLIIDWFLRTLPARIRREQRIHQRIIEKIKSKKDEIQKARQLAKQLAKPKAPKPLEKPEVLSRKQKSRLTRIKHSIQRIKQGQAAKTLQQMKNTAHRIGFTPIQKIKYTIKQKLSKKPEPKYKLSKELKSIEKFDKKISKYLESKPEKIPTYKDKRFTKIKKAITRIADKTPSLEKELKQLSKDIKKAKPKHRIKDIKKKYISPISAAAEKIRNKIQEKQKAYRKRKKQKQKELKKIRKQQERIKQEKQKQKEKQRKQQEKQKQKEIQKQIKAEQKIQKEEEKRQQERQEKIQEQKRKEQKRKQREKRKQQKHLKKLKKQQEKEKKKLERQKEKKLRKEIQKTQQFEKQLDKYLKTTKTAKKETEFEKLKQEVYAIHEPHKIKPKKIPVKKARKRKKKLPKKYKKEIEKTLKFEKQLDKYLNS